MVARAGSRTQPRYEPGARFFSSHTVNSEASEARGERLEELKGQVTTFLADTALGVPDDEPWEKERRLKEFWRRYSLWIEETRQLGYEVPADDCQEPDTKFSQTESGQWAAVHQTSGVGATANSANEARQELRKQLEQHLGLWQELLELDPSATPDQIKDNLVEAWYDAHQVSNEALAAAAS